MFDRRNYLRYVLEGSVNIKSDSNAPNIFKAVLVDIGFTGLSVFLKESLEIGTFVQFELVSTLTENPLIGTGKVKNIREAKMYGNAGVRIGIEFVKVDNDIVISILNKIQTKIGQEKRIRWETKGLDIGPL